MKRLPLGPDATVSAIGFGGMLLSIDGRPDEDQAIRVLHAVLDAGVTLIDTADVYSLDASDLGHNERLVRRALDTWSGDRDAVIVATKGGSTHPDRRTWKPDGRPEHLRAACEASLSALGVERIDLYQLHSPDPHIPYAESLGALAELREEGKVRWVGVSNVNRKNFELARSMLPVRTVQNALSPYLRGPIGARRFRKSLVRRCAKLGIAFLAHSPLGGWLSGRLAGHPVLARIAGAHGVSAHAVVLAWVRSKGANVVPLAGARTVEHALDSIRSVELVLERAELAAIDRADFPRESQENAD